MQAAASPVPAAAAVTMTVTALPGATELREDAPLRAGGGGGGGGGGGRCGAGAGGPRLLAACFGALSCGVTLALLTQIYAGDAQLAPHGSAASDAAPCSRAATDLLKAGGAALDAAALAALCLAALRPDVASLHAGGTLLHWEYRRARTQPPSYVQWEGAPARPPPLLRALAALHAKLGALPWGRLVSPALHLARERAEELRAEGAGGAPLEEVVEWLASVRGNSSRELAAAWGAAGLELVPVAPVAERGGAWRVWGAPDAGPAARAMLAALRGGAPGVEGRAAAELRGRDGGRPAPASGVAVVDPRDTYVALVVGPPQRPAADGAPPAPASLQLAPAIITQDHICGARYVVGATSWGALAAGGAALAARGAPDAGEGAPVAGALNVVRQRGDALASHADSRGGGLASRF